MKKVKNNNKSKGQKNMTELEISVLNIIATSDYNQLNGSIPRTIEESATFLWVDEIAVDAGLTMNQVKGVLGSLVKKKLIVIDDIDADEETLVSITQEGIHILWDGINRKEKIHV